ncbi:AMP-activated serine/threonine-protein kinase regulatory subunit [Linnemannia zychae]|nr:AMP-activated serine/threonine-protein kinase regulatory subunit [Linnemannia zychae]
MTDPDSVQGNVNSHDIMTTDQVNGIRSTENSQSLPVSSHQSTQVQRDFQNSGNLNGNSQDKSAHQESIPPAPTTQRNQYDINDHSNNFIDNATFAEHTPHQSTASPLQPVSNLATALAQSLILDPAQPTNTVGTGAVDVLATENIDPVASYSAWRKKKDTETLHGTQAMMETFLKQHSAYDVLPVSYRQIVMDTTLLVKKALSVLMQYGIVSAPLWDSTKRKFAGMLTATDFINLIQFYYSHSSYAAASREMDLFQISQLRDVEKVIGVPPPELFSLHPLQSLYDACHLLVESRAHRLPLVDVDSETGEEMIVSYQDEKTLRQPLSELKIGIYKDLAIADLSTPVIDVIDMFVKRKISSVPIVDEEGVVLNVYETVDVLTLVKAGAYRDLDLCVAEALLRRPEDFAGVHTCTLNDSLSSIFGTIRKSQVHRLIVVDSENKLKGIVSLSDIMRYLIGGTRDDVSKTDMTISGSSMSTNDDQHPGATRGAVASTENAADKR